MILQQLEHLNIWLVYQRAWCEHKPSITVSVKEDEWMEVGAWVYKHFDEVSGISFLPHSDHSYKQAPYQEVTEDRIRRTPCKDAIKIFAGKICLSMKQKTEHHGTPDACLYIRWKL
jgi:ribonucleoside-diphosphate reductase alpha chain